MSWRYLGETFDIHGGGRDLIFPHHENELAQSLCAFPSSRFARVWLHNGMLRVNGEKMSKSLGNFVTIRDALANWPGEVIRMTMLKTHYRQPIDWTLASLRETKRELDRMYPLATQFAASAAMVPPEFMAALEDDLNTPEAITILRRLYSEAVDGVLHAGARLASCGHMLGLFQKSLPEWIGWRPASAQIDELHVQRLINARLAARKSKDFAESDRIRDELAALGVQLKDDKGPDGEPVTTWEVKL
jgi:cysteinyl-tRNA synthetase